MKKDTIAAGLILCGFFSTFSYAANLHTVKPGENLYRIGLMYGYPYQKVAKWNNFPTSQAIEVGQVLRVSPPQEQSLLPANSEDELQKGLAAMEDENFGNAFKILLPLATKGDSEAQHRIGFMYITGQGTSKNPEKGFYWTKRAATSGLGGSAYNIAKMYEKGDGTEKNLEEASKWYKIAAERGEDIEDNLSRVDSLIKTKY